MYNISASNNTVIIDNGERKWAFPKGTLWIHADSGEKQSIDIKLAATRATLMTFRYDQCNLAGADAIGTINNILQIV